MTIRLTAVMTHPVQYMAPWFRYIASACPAIDLTVLYVTQPTPAQQGVGFDQPLAWDQPLTEGYRCRVLRPARPGDDLRSARFAGIDTPHMAAAIRATQPDVALVAGWHSLAQVRALAACRRFGIPVLYRGDTHLGSRPDGWRGRTWPLRTRLALRAFAAYLSVGHRARAYLETFAAPGAPIFDAPHCVDNDFFARQAAPHQTRAGRAAARAELGIAPDEFAILFAGKLEAVKRPLDLVDAAARLGSGARLIVAGAGPLAMACGERARACGLALTLCGFVNQSQLGTVYAAADCLALPSASETWGLVVNEAMATGLPCAVSDAVGCAPDLIVPGETGEIFTAGDVAQLAAALGRVRDRRAAGHDFAPACRARIAGYSFAAATAGLLAACQAVARPGARVVAYCGGMVSVFGLERATFEALRALRQRGASVHCIVNEWENHRIVALADEIGASHSTAPHRVPLRRTRDLRQLTRAGRDALRSSVALWRAARAHRATHILLAEFMDVLRAAPALAALRAGGVVIVLGVQNAPTDTPRYARLWRRAISPLVDRIVCSSADAQRGLLDHGVPIAKLAVIHNIAPQRAVRSAAAARDDRRVIYIGQIIPEKGLDLLLDAMGLLVARGADVRLDVVGRIDGWVSPSYHGYREQLLARAAAPDLAGRVRFVGWSEEVPALLSAAAVHCCPSRPEMREGLPLVVLEAKEAGVPSVAFAVGPFSELITHGEDGWLCPEVSAAALAEGLDQFLRDPTRLRAAGEAARRSSARFGRAPFADAWWALCRGATPDTERT